ncbi:hypothetical protein [Caenimonas sedimenti]|uniref:hypothetical protein n=1 Tax=Caenimonas sedimenti TaxID=2596921 RepID=UPI001645A984|nr:hypothetical protein [Caenimonas sedimenti]
MDEPVVEAAGLQQGSAKRNGRLHGLGVRAGACTGLAQQAHGRIDITLPAALLTLDTQRFTFTRPSRGEHQATQASQQHEPGS